MSFRSFRSLAPAGALLACMLPSTGLAVVTYSGSEGVAAQVFSNCAGCHDSSAQSGGRRFDTHGFATQYLTLGDLAGAVTATGYSDVRGNVRVGAGEMPSGSPLTQPLRDLLSAWTSQRSGATPPPNTAAPEITTAAASSIGKYSATLNGSVIENGSNVTFSFKYSTSSATVGAGNGTSVSVTSDNTSDSGGANVSYSVSGGVSGLSCGTTYYYRAHGGGAQGSTRSFSTLACPAITGTTGTTTLNEDQSFSITLSTVGGVTGYTLNSPPAGLTRLANVLSWPAASTPDSPTANTDYAFSVSVTDGTTTSANFPVTLTVMPLNDAPTLAAVANNSATKNNLFTYNIGALYFSDVDDANPGGVTWSLPVFPVGMSISTSGVISWTPGNSALATENVTVQVQDGGENGSSAVQRSFTISVGGLNVGPTLDAITNKSVNEDSLLTFAAGVTDPDDPNNGSGALSWSLTGAPTGMSVSNTGVVSWTPDQSALAGGGLTARTYSVTVNVQDGMENGAVAASTAFDVTVNPVNDSPVVSAIADQSLAVSTFTLTASASDPDNTADQLTWSLSGAPAGMSISNAAATRGRISWTAPDATPVAVTVTVRATDTGNTFDDEAFSFVVQDTDSDAVADHGDNCPAVTNASQLDTDIDGLGNACDSDDDGDTISDAAELANALDPLLASDATADKDGDGLSNATEYATCAGNGDTTACPAISIDSVGPVISVGADVFVTATAYFTPTPAGITATATDGNDGLVAVTADKSGPFVSGEHVITWTAEDSAGNTTSATQLLVIRPLVTLGGTQIVAEGDVVAVTARLSGPAPSYPVEVAYSLGGTADAADHTLSGGVFTFGSGATESQILFKVEADALSEGDESLVLTLDDVTGAAEPGTTLSHRILIAATQKIPTASLQIMQQGELRPVVYNDAGPTTLVLDVRDVNGDALTISWAPGSLNGILSGDRLTFTIDTVTVVPGRYPVVVTVSDGTASIRREIALVVGNATPVLTVADTDGDGITDVVEGVKDEDGDGLQDYLDAVMSPDAMLLRSGSGASLLRTAVTEPGLQLVAGSFASAAQTGGLQVYATQVVDAGNSIITDSAYLALGAIYDFEIRGITAVDPSVSVVLSLPVALPPNAVWRLPKNDRWQDFVTTGSDAIYSAVSVNGQCPGIVSASWRVGLVAGSDCVRLTISDGGPNDADGAKDGVIRETGAAAVLRSEAPAENPDGSQTGGSADGWMFMILGLLLMQARRRYREFH